MSECTMIRSILIIARQAQASSALTILPELRSSTVSRVPFTEVDRAKMQMTQLTASHGGSHLWMEGFVKQSVFRPCVWAHFGLLSVMH